MDIKTLEAEIDQITAQFNFEIGKRRGMIELLKQQEEDKKKPIVDNNPDHNPVATPLEKIEEKVKEDKK